MRLIPHALLFQTRQRIKKLKAGKQVWNRSLTDSYRLDDLNGLDNRPRFAELRAGWSENGLLFNVEVVGKEHPLQSDPQQPLSSDGLQLWIDTRNTPGVHRANRFCHLICASPSGGGKNREQPWVRQLEIPRCREASPLAGPDAFRCRSKLNKDGYSIALWIPADALNGFDPEQSPILGFYCALRDEELGTQTFGLGDEFPYQSDPSLWQSLELAADA
jgi:hypothetical protein